MLNPTSSSQDENGVSLPFISSNVNEQSMFTFAAPPALGSMEQTPENTLSPYSSSTNLSNMIDQLHIQSPHLSAQPSQAGALSTEYSVEPAQQYGFGQMLNQQPIINQGEAHHQFWTPAPTTSLVPNMLYTSVPTQVIPALSFHETSALPVDSSQPEKQNQLVLYNQHQYENQSSNSLLQIPIYPPHGSHSQLVFPNYQEQSQSLPLVDYKQSEAAGPDPDRCGVCNINNSPTWRRHKLTGARVCNACGLYYALHQKNREFIINSHGNRVVKRQPRGTGNRRAAKSKTQKKRVEAVLQFVPNPGYYGVGNVPRMGSFNSSSQSTTHADEY